MFASYREVWESYGVNQGINKLDTFLGHVEKDIETFNYKMIKLASK